MCAVATDELVVVVTSVGTEDQAIDIAHALVRSHQAACVNLLPNVHSIYRWKGRVCSDGEFLLLVKTSAQHFTALRDTIQRVNTYELPEVLAYRVDEASPAIARWITQTTAAKARKRDTKLKAVPPVKRRRAAAR